MRVIIKAPGRIPLITDIKNTLERLQSAVGGYIEAVPMISPGVVCICNEEGKIKRGFEPNFFFFHDVIMGTAVFAGTGEEEFRSLTNDEIGSVIDYLGNNRLLR